MDGPFWVIWIFFFTPAVTAWSIWAGHLAAIEWWGVAASFYFMMLGVTLGFHRYFSHRSFTTSRLFQFVLGLMGTLSGQTGPLSWSMGHEIHHKNCERQPDPHSTNVSFLHAQGFWLWTGKSRFDNLEDSQWFKYPELVFLEALAPIIYYSSGVVLYFTLGLEAVIWYWLVPTCLSFNATMMINSLGHGHGLFPYKDFYQPEHCRATNIPWAWPFILGTTGTTTITRTPTPPSTAGSGGRSTLTATCSTCFRSSASCAARSSPVRRCWPSTRPTAA